MTELIDIVSWVLPSEKMLKLEKTGETYDISDNLFISLEKGGILDKLENQEVTIKIDDGAITFLECLNSGTTKEVAKENTETTSEEPYNKDNIVKELTVNGVSVAKKGVIFKEEENVWYTLDDSIDAEEFKFMCTKKVVEVYIQETDKGNDVIKGFTVKQVEKKEDEENKDTGKQKPTYNNTSNSIEAQASMKSAYTIVASMVDKDSKPDFVLKLITTIAKHSYKTLQDLKKKE